jgi:hypothetical protein
VGILANPQVPSVACDGSERMAEIVTVLSVVGELVAVLTAKLISATADEIPSLREEAETLAQRVVECCMDTAPVDHLPPEEVAELRAELFQLGDSLRAQIADIVDVCWARLLGGGTSQTRH